MTVSETLLAEARAVLAEHPRVTTRYAAEQAILRLRGPEFTDFYGNLLPDAVPAFERLAAEVEWALLAEKTRGAAAA